jgi:hypothetical protein
MLGLIRKIHLSAGLSTQAAAAAAHAAAQMNLPDQT